MYFAVMRSKPRMLIPFSLHYWKSLPDRCSDYKICINYYIFKYIRAKVLIPLVSELWLYFLSASENKN